MIVEHLRLANLLLDHVGDLGWHVEVYRFRSSSVVEIRAIHVVTGESILIETEDVYCAAVELAVQAGLELAS